MSSAPQVELGFGGAPESLAADWRQQPLAQGWEPLVEQFFRGPSGQGLMAFLEERMRRGAVIFPAWPLRALELTPLDSIHAVILGQDPYHGPGQAEGLAFSVPSGVKLPPSLRNIFQELQFDGRPPEPGTGSLQRWARQGVLLLNSSLTVEAGEPASHAGKGWEQLTSAIVSEVASRACACVWMLWGAHAQAKEELIEASAMRHGHETLILKANHPSPLSARRPPAPFLGCGHFSLARQWLAERGFPGYF